ncbi:Trypsin iota [Frankliniella fusca]|uniref:Trypsin iota n=1 Tax=Frankliniella fusca TaxID=407009 RepID=A0AAE1HWV8_9NEOP|nr:Trypsin iota [Frankliniella fusca]
MYARTSRSPRPGALGAATGAAALVLAAIIVAVSAPAESAKLGKGSAISPFIVGGDDARPGQFPELVSVQAGYGEYQHLCGGFIIDQRWVLTAGHCLDQVDPAAITILAGTVDLSSPSASAVRVPIAGYEIHEEYDPAQVSLPHDIALIELVDPIPLSEDIQVASLQNVLPSDGDIVTVAGWGQTKVDEAVASNSLEYTQLNVVDRDACQAKLQGYAEILDDQICAASSSGLHAECKGDSGGALFADGLVVGIVSWSRKPCGSYPGVFAGIPQHYAWIRDRSGLQDL